MEERCIFKSLILHFTILLCIGTNLLLSDKDDALALVLARLNFVDRMTSVLQAVLDVLSILDLSVGNLPGYDLVELILIFRAECEYEEAIYLELLRNDIHKVLDWRGLPVVSGDHATFLSYANQ